MAADFFLESRMTPAGCALFSPVLQKRAVTYRGVYGLLLRPEDRSMYSVSNFKHNGTRLHTQARHKPMLEAFNSIWQCFMNSLVHSVSFCMYKFYNTKGGVRKPLELEKGKLSILHRYKITYVGNNTLEITE
jgi:hypothetical protein